MVERMLPYERTVRQAGTAASRIHFGRCAVSVSVFLRRDRRELSPPTARTTPRRVPDVGDVNLVRIDRIKDEITKTRRNDNANVRFVRFASRERIVAELTRALDKTRDKT